MIRTYLFFLVSFFIISVTVAQSSQTDSLLTLIKTEVKTLEDENNWSEIKEFQIENFTTKGAFLKLFYKENKLQKMTLVGHNTYAVVKKNFYLSKSELIFVLEKEYEFHDITTKDTVNDMLNLVYKTESYFKNDKLIRQLESNDSGHPFSEEYLKAMGDSILEDFKLLLIVSQTQG